MEATNLQSEAGANPNCASEETTAPFLEAITCAHWQTECETAVFCLTRLLAITGRAIAASAVIELLRTIPRSPDQDEQTETLFPRCIMEAYEKAGSIDRSPLRSVLDFTRRYREMPAVKQSLLEASIIGALLGFGMEGEPMRERQIHDCAFAIAWRIMELIRPLIREEEQRDFIEEAVLVARQEVERMLTAAEPGGAAPADGKNLNVAKRDC